LTPFCLMPTAFAFDRPLCTRHIAQKLVSFSYPIVRFPLCILGCFHCFLLKLKIHLSAAYSEAIFIPPSDVSNLESLLRLFPPFTPRRFNVSIHLGRPCFVTSINKRELRSYVFSCGLSRLPLILRFCRLFELSCLQSLSQPPAFVGRLFRSFIRHVHMCSSQPLPVFCRKNQFPPPCSPCGRHFRSPLYVFVHFLSVLIPPAPWTSPVPKILLRSPL